MSQPMLTKSILSQLVTRHMLCFSSKKNNINHLFLSLGDTLDMICHFFMALPNGIF